MNPLEDYIYIRLCFHSWKRLTINLLEINNQNGIPLLENTDESKNTEDLQISFYNKRLEEKIHSPSEINNFIKVDYPQYGPEFGKWFFQEENILHSKDRSFQDDSRKTILQKFH